MLSVLAECLTVLSLFIFTFISGQSILGLSQGEVCKGQGRQASTCQFILNCPQIGDFKRTRPKICNFEGVDPIICCPPATRITTTNNNNNNNKNNNNKNSIIATNGNAEKTCRQRIAKICNSSTSTSLRVTRQAVFRPFVVGGRKSAPRVHKYMVLVGYGTSRKSWDCGGSLISERWVLSAAHCAKSPSQGPARWTRVGDLDTSTTNEDARPQEKRIIQRILHPRYREPGVYNDIALFKLDSNVKINEWVAPICLNARNEISVTKATVTGWGRLDFAGEVSPTLQEVEITLVNGTECRRLYSTSIDSKIPRGIDVQTMICAGEREGGKDACSGDSGGPLVVDVPGNCLKVQIGITSFGRECGLPNTPGVYTRVSQFIPWIESIVWPK